jgi:hypothetical protein
MASIISSELEIYKSTFDDSTPSSNGGVMTTNKVTSGGVQNVFPHVFKAERVAGSTKYRKIFLKVSNDSDNTLFNPQIWLDRPTPGDDYVVMFAGTQSDTQVSKTEAKWYGTAYLGGAITGGVTTTIIATVADECHMAGATPIFAANDVIHLSNKVDPDSVAGDEELVTISAAAPTDGVQNGDGTWPVTFVVTAAPTQSYVAYNGTTELNSRISTVYEPSDVAASSSSWTENQVAGSGNYDEGVYPLILDNIGTIYDTWTLTFTDAANVTVVGLLTGSLGSFPIASDISIDNTDWGTGKKYFTLYAAGWGTGWLATDNITFITSPAAVPMWERRDVEINATSVANNRVVHVSTGEAV